MRSKKIDYSKLQITCGRKMFDDVYDSNLDYILPVCGFKSSFNFSKVNYFVDEQRKIHNEAFFLSKEIIKKCHEAFSDSYKFPVHYNIELSDVLITGCEFNIIANRFILKDTLYLSNKKIAVAMLLGSEIIKGDNDCKYILACNGGYRNFYHFFTQGAAGLLDSMRYVGDYKYKIVVPDTKLAIDVCKAIGFDDDNLYVLPDNKSLNAKSVFYSSLLSGYGAYQPLPVVRDLLLNSFMQFSNSSQDSFSKIYISRSDSRRRLIVNEAELADAMSKLGFKVVVLSHLSISDQINVFRQAKFIVAPHGAGLSHLFFVGSDVKLVEIFSENCINPCYFRISQLMGMHYAGVVASVVDNKSKHDSTCKVNVHEIVEIINKMELI